MKYLTTYFRTPLFRGRYGHIGFIIARRCDCDLDCEVVSKPLMIGGRAEYFYAPKNFCSDLTDTFGSKSNEIFLFNLIKIESKIKEIQVKALASRSLRHN